MEAKKVSHKLSTLATSVNGYFYLLNKEINENSGENQKKYLESLSDSINKLTNQLEELNKVLNN